MVLGRFHMSFSPQCLLVLPVSDLKTAELQRGGGLEIGYAAVLRWDREWEVQNGFENHPLLFTRVKDF